MLKRKYTVVYLFIVCCLSSCILNTSSLVTYDYKQLNNSSDKKYKLEAKMANNIFYFVINELDNNFENINDMIICSEGNKCYEMYRNDEFGYTYFAKKFTFSKKKFKEIFNHDTVYIKLISENEIQRLKFLKQELNTYKN